MFFIEENIFGIIYYKLIDILCDICDTITFEIPMYYKTVVTEKNKMLIPGQDIGYTRYNYDHFGDYLNCIEKANTIFKSCEDSILYSYDDVEYSGEINIYQRKIYVLKFTEKVKELLKKSDSILDWSFPKNPSNISFYNNGSCVLSYIEKFDFFTIYIYSHEKLIEEFMLNEKIDCKELNYYPKISLLTYEEAKSISIKDDKDIIEKMKQKYLDGSYRKFVPAEILGEISGKQYTNLIDFLLSNSDIVTFSVPKPLKLISNARNNIINISKQETITYGQGQLEDYKKMEQALLRADNIFNEYKANIIFTYNDVIYGDDIYHYEHKIYVISVDERLKELFSLTDNLYKWCYPNLPESPIFYKDGLSFWKSNTKLKESFIFSTETNVVDFLQKSRILFKNASYMNSFQLISQKKVNEIEYYDDKKFFSNVSTYLGDGTYKCVRIFELNVTNKCYLLFKYLMNNCDTIKFSFDEKLDTLQNYSKDIIDILNKHKINYIISDHFENKFFEVKVSAGDTLQYLFSLLDNLPQLYIYFCKNGILVAKTIYHEYECDVYYNINDNTYEDLKNMGFYIGVPFDTIPIIE